MGPPTYIGGNSNHPLTHNLRLNLASMGPPTYIGGNTKKPIPTFFDFIMLQWGHRLTSVETSDNVGRIPPNGL